MYFHPQTEKFGVTGVDAFLRVTTSYGVQEEFQEKVTIALEGPGADADYTASESDGA